MLNKVFYSFFACGLFFNISNVKNLEAKEAKGIMQKINLDYEVFDEGDNKYFRLKPTNFPCHRNINLDVQDVNGKKIKESVVQAENNKIIDFSTKKEWIFSVDKVAKGEPIACYLRGENNLFKWVYFTPKPYEIKDEQGHVISITLATGSGEIFSIKGSGYKPYECLDIIHQHEETVTKEYLIAGGKGDFITSATWYDLGKEPKAYMRVIGKDTDLKLEYNLGQKFKQY